MNDKKTVKIGDEVINPSTGLYFGKVLDIKDNDVIIQNNGITAKVSRRVVENIINSN